MHAALTAFVLYNFYAYIRFPLIPDTMDHGVMLDFGERADLGAPKPPRSKVA